MLWFLFLGNMFLIVLLYMTLTTEKTQRPPTFMMNAIMTPPTLFALCSGFLFTCMYPGFLVETSIAAAILGIGCGLLFGSLYDLHSAMAGASTGMMAGIMAPMLGEMTGRTPSLLLFLHVLFFILLCYFRFSVPSSHQKGPGHL